MTSIASMISPTEISLIPMTLLLLTLNLLVGTAASPHGECVEKLVGFSALQNNSTGAVSPKYCDAISLLFNSTAVSNSCICHLLRDPQSFGVPVNISRVCLGNTTHSLECPSVDEFKGEFVSKFEDALRKCDIVIHASCGGKEEQCCRDLCEKRLPYGKTMDVRYTIINGSLTCYCHIIYQEKPDSCVILLNF